MKRLFIVAALLISIGTAVALEDKGRILVIRPQKPIRVSRMEKDPAKLQELYDEGYAEASKVLSFFK